jgi:hypothetical protein
MAWNDTFSAFKTKPYNYRTKTIFPKFWPIIQLANCSLISDLRAKLSERKLFPITSKTFTATFFPLLSIHWKWDTIFQDTTQKRHKNGGNMPSSLCETWQEPIKNWHESRYQSLMRDKLWWPYNYVTWCVETFFQVIPESWMKSGAKLITWPGPRSQMSIPTGMVNKASFYLDKYLVINLQLSSVSNFMLLWTMETSDFVFLFPCIQLWVASLDIGLDVCH